jgi:hypothetical protein
MMEFKAKNNVKLTVGDWIGIIPYI